MNRTHSYTTFETALGPFSVAMDEDGGIVATAFGGLDELETRKKRVDLVRDDARAALPRAQITDYLDGRRSEFDLRLAAVGSEYQHRVWDALCQIPRGETRSYGALAKNLRSSARAVGQANARNPICLIVPCHRVIGADGKLAGFAFGEEIKRRLLALEGAVGF